MISYGKQTIDDSDINSVVKALKGDWLTQGPSVDNFEHKLAKFFGSKYASVVSSGTAALHLVLKALELSSEDIVITSPITFLASANCIEYVGCKTDFIDIDIDTYTLDPNLLRDRLKMDKESGNHIKAIIGVDYAGHPCNWKALRQIADEFNLVLINDNCHALGASYQGDNKYAIKYADFVTQSFHPVKHITTGEGGAIMTNDKVFYDKINVLRSHGMLKDSFMRKEYGPWYYEMHQLGYNYRITDIQCALGINQLKRINDFLSKRKKIAKTYDEELSEFNMFKTPTVISNVGHAYHLYPLRINFNYLEKSKKDLFEYLLDHDINLQVHYIPVHTQPYYKKNIIIMKAITPYPKNFTCKKSLCQYTQAYLKVIKAM